MDESFMTVSELKKILGCGNDKAYALVKQKGFPSFRVGSRYYIIRDDFYVWVKHQSRKAS